MIYELRIYHMHPGRLPAIHKRFADETLSLFERHGLRVVDFWEDADGHETLYYILEHPDRETRDKRWEAFRNDADWQAAKDASEKDGPIVRQVDEIFMTRVPYWPRNSQK